MNRGNWLVKWGILGVLLPLLGCGEFLWPKGNSAIYNSRTWGFVVVAGDSALEADINQNHIDKFLAGIEPYMAKVMPELQATGLLSDVLFIPGNEHIDELNISIATGLTVRGYFNHNLAIVLNVEDRMLSVYGHELVRYLLYMSGERGLAFNSSLDWSGDIGILWNIAETASLEFI